MDAAGNTAVNGLLGTAAPLLGVITSLQEQVEWGLRIGSLLVGLVIGIISLYQLLRKL